MTREDLLSMAGQVVRVRWNHNPGFSRDMVVKEGFGIVLLRGDVHVVTKEYDKHLGLDKYGNTWEAIPVTVGWHWPGGEGKTP